MTLTCPTKTFTIVFSKVVNAISNGDLLTDLDIPYSHDLHAMRASGTQPGIGVAIVIREPRWTKKQTGRLLSTAHDN